VSARGFDGVAAALAGLLFGAGLALSGMLRPAKVIAFLDFGGAWDASLAVVMLAAVTVHTLALRLLRGRSAPLFGERFWSPARRGLDARLLGGAAVFGVGWGLSGYCPGPALVGLVTLERGTIVFVGALLLGMWLVSLLDRARLSAGAATDAQA
jgi:uncharacterized protein